MNKLNKLTSLRFIAAFIVVIYHIILLFFFNGFYQSHTWILKFFPGFQAVCFFFVLSGFVLTINYFNEFNNTPNWNSINKFYSARIARIYPLFFIVVTIVFITSLFYMETSFELFNFNKALTVNQSILNYITDIGIISIFTIPFSLAFKSNIPLWSIAAEIVFYLFFPFLLTFISKISNNYESIIKRIFWGSFWINTFLFFLVFEYNSRLLYKIQTLLYLNPFIRIFEFIIGMVIGVAYVKGYKLNLKHALLSFILVILFYNTYYLVPSDTSKWLDYMSWFVFPIPFVSYIIWTIANNKNINILENKFFILLGDASFSLYVIHMPILNAAKYFNMPITFLPLLVLFLILTSIAIYKYFEIPAKNFVYHKLNKN